MTSTYNNGKNGNTGEFTYESIQRAIDELKADMSIPEIEDYAELLRQDLAALKTAYILRRSLALEDDRPFSTIESLKDA
ncbi:MAG TPA: hypothetical protein V6D22_17050 [Candidatus Obscuribacterales bacterium]